MNKYTFIIYAACLLSFLISCKNEKATRDQDSLVTKVDQDGPSTKTEQQSDPLTPEADPEKQIVESRFNAPDGWVEFTDETPGFVTDIRYATDNNFVKAVMYDCGKCFLREQAANALFLVAAELSRYDLGIKLFDCYRPAPVQQKLWDKVPNASYVTPPWKGSQHNRGVAVDLTIVDEAGNQLDMGTSFDYFGEEAHYTYTGHSARVNQNRMLLKSVMEQYGFASIRTEWWHFSIKELQSLEVSEWEWECE